MQLLLNPNYGLYRKDDKAFCDSLQVAETFGKEHYNVMRDIETLDCSDEFNTLNFEGINYKDSRGRRQRKYIMTKDGFTFLVMGYRGKKAAQFKEAYIKRFNEMEKYITILTDVKEDFPEFTEAVKLSNAVPKPHHYINEINMLYSLVLSGSVRSFKKMHSITSGSIRDYMTTEQLLQFRKLQKVDIGLLMVVPELMQRKKILQRITKGGGTNGEDNA